MLNLFTFEQILAKNQEKYHYDPVTKTITGENGSPLFTVEELWDKYAKKSGLSFECIDDEHVQYLSVLRCTECGTVIFYRYDEDYEDNFSCPIYTKYETGYEYWTKEQIESDKEKQDTIKQYQEMAVYWQESDMLKKKRGLERWQVAKKEIKTRNGKTVFEFTCHDIKDGWWRGLALIIQRWSKVENVYAWKSQVYIPLCPSSFRVFLKMCTT